MTRTQSHEEPAVRRWQEQYEIPVRVEQLDIDDTDGSRIVWEYDRLLIPALTPLDVAATVARDFDGDELVLADAIERLHAALNGAQA